MPRNGTGTGKLAGRIVSVSLVMSTLLLLILLPFHFGLRFQGVQTSSMEPSFFPGDELISITKPVSDLRVGEVVTLISSVTGLPVTHRIFAIDTVQQNGSRQYLVTTKGDANVDADPTYTFNGTDQISKAVRIISGGAYALKTIQTNLPKGLGVLALLVLAVFIALRRVRKDIVEIADSRLVIGAASPQPSSRGRRATDQIGQVNYGRRATDRSETSMPVRGRRASDYAPSAPLVQEATDKMAVVMPFVPTESFDPRVTDIRVMSRTNP